MCKGRGGNNSVPADVHVTRANLVGPTETVAMHEDRQNVYVSYTGTYHPITISLGRWSSSPSEPGQKYRFES